MFLRICFRDFNNCLLSLGSVLLFLITLSMSAEPRIRFNKFKGFPEVDFNGNARVPTHEFLIASKEVVSAIGESRRVTLSLPPNC